VAHVLAGGAALRGGHSFGDEAGATRQQVVPRRWVDFVWQSTASAGQNAAVPRLYYIIMWFLDKKIPFRVALSCGLFQVKLMKRLLLVLSGLLLGLGAGAQTKPAELLLLGTFHFHNPGADIVKTKSFDVLAPRAQAELETVTGRLSQWHPDKVFVEWDWNNQPELDALYQLYLGGQYEQAILAKYAKPGQRDFYLKNEIIQLAFRTAKKAGLPRVYAFDYTKTTFPFDSVQKAMQQAHQQVLMQRIGDLFKKVEADQNQKLGTFTLTQLLLDFNTPRSLAENKGLYLDLLNKAGSVGSFTGPWLVSEWYRRNLYMYSVVQKTVEPTDKRVLVLVGSGHAAMMQDFAQYDTAFKLTSLKDVLK
jgi:hypothetical protein